MTTATEKSLAQFLLKEYPSELLKHGETFKYLTIVNPNTEAVAFCISAPKELPLADTLITVQAHYGDTEVGLQAVFSEPFPNFLQVTQ